MEIAVTITVVTFMFYTYYERLYFSLSNGIYMILVGRVLKKL